jgi:hypothetical protein
MAFFRLALPSLRQDRGTPTAAHVATTSSDADSSTNGRHRGEPEGWRSENHETGEPKEENEENEHEPPRNTPRERCSVKESVGEVKEACRWLMVTGAT